MNETITNFDSGCFVFFSLHPGQFVISSETAIEIYPGKWYDNKYRYYKQTLYLFCFSEDRTKRHEVKDRPDWDTHKAVLSVVAIYSYIYLRWLHAVDRFATGEFSRTRACFIRAEWVLHTRCGSQLITRRAKFAERCSHSTPWAQHEKKHFVIYFFFLHLLVVSSVSHCALGLRLWPQSRNSRWRIKLNKTYTDARGQLNGK